MTSHSVSREDILDALQNALEPLDYVKAMWQGGAAAFGRVDQWSDVDLMVIADDEHVEGVMRLVDEALEALSPITSRYELPQPSWHGHLQTFYRLEGASRFHFVDFVVMKQSNEKRFLECEIHGEALFYFDRIGGLADVHIDESAHLEAMQARAKELAFEFDFFAEIVEKEILRENWLDALPYYTRFTLMPLMEILRMQHSPGRYNFYTRYATEDLPAELIAEIEPFFFPQPGADFAAKNDAARALFTKALKGLDWGE